MRSPVCPLLLCLVSVLRQASSQTETGLIAACKDVDGTLHKLNESYIGPDGCNRCKCMEGGSACTKKFCPDTITSREAEANQCVDNRGVLHEMGDSFTHVDGCNTCKCTEHGGACTRKFCLKEATCEEGREEGETWVHKDGCNKCQCSILGAVCSENRCAALQVPRQGTHENTDIVDESGDRPCEDSNGNTRFPGATWLTGDSCNICQCHGNSTAPDCTKMGCRVRLERLRQSDLSDPSSGSRSIPTLLSLLSVLAISLVVVS